MDNVATASLNTFGIAPKANVSPSEDPIFVLTASQLQDIISRALQPLQNEVMELKATVASQGEEIKSLKADTKMDNEDIRDLYRHVEALARVEPQPLQKDRGEILRALIAANGGKMLAKEARAKMHLSKNRFSELLARMKDSIETKSLHSDKRKLVLILR
mgnify:CR=1 FL=1